MWQSSSFNLPFLYFTSNYSTVLIMLCLRVYINVELGARPIYMNYYYCCCCCPCARIYFSGALFGGRKLQRNKCHVVELTNILYRRVVDDCSKILQKWVMWVFYIYWWSIYITNNSFLI